MSGDFGEIVRGGCPRRTFPALFWRICNSVLHYLQQSNSGRTRALNGLIHVCSGNRFLILLIKVTRPSFFGGVPSFTLSPPLLLS